MPTLLRSLYTISACVARLTLDAERQHGFVGKPEPAVPLVLRQRTKDVDFDDPADGRRDCRERPPQGRASLHRVPELLRTVENPFRGHALTSHIAKARSSQRPLHGPRLAKAEKIGGARRRVERIAAFKGAADDPQRVDLALRAPGGDGHAPAG